jgi:hypothetical protein
MSVGQRNRNGEIIVPYPQSMSIGGGFKPAYKAVESPLSPATGGVIQKGLEPEIVKPLAEIPPTAAVYKSSGHRDQSVAERRNTDDY